MIASHAHRFIFLKTRKTAGTSIEISLSRVCGPDDIITSISPDDEVLRRAAGGRGRQNCDSPPLPRKAFNHMGAALVREVVGRQVWEDYFTFAVERNPWDAVVSLYYWKYRDRPQPPAFDQYVSEPWIEKLAENRRIYRIRGEIAVDRVLRYERLDEELREVWDQLGLPLAPDLPHAKGHARAPGHYRELYNARSRQRVAEVFADTIEAFGYEF